MRPCRITPALSLRAHQVLLEELDEAHEAEDARHAQDLLHSCQHLAVTHTASLTSQQLAPNKQLLGCNSSEGHLPDMSLAKLQCKPCMLWLCMCKEVHVDESPAGMTGA